MLILFKVLVSIFIVEMREVKEIRLGKYSKDFDKWSEESSNFDPMQCFVIFYGSEFKLKVFSVAGKNSLRPASFLNRIGTISYLSPMFIFLYSLIGERMRTLA